MRPILQLAVKLALAAAAALVAGAHRATPAPFSIAARDFRASRFPFNASFFGTTPYPDKAGLGCAEDATKGEECFFRSDDPWLKATLPAWRPAAGAMTTRPWTDGFSAPRLLGGIADHDPEANTYTPNFEFEVVTRGSNGELVYNWTRIDETIDGWLHGAKTTRFLLVLDNVPYCFVRPENRYYLGFGMGAAPDDPEEFGVFIGALARHLVERYTLSVVSTWRFRLGTECDGPRYGPSWVNLTAPNPPFVMADGNGGNYTSRVNGLDKYVDTYLAVAKALKAVVPDAAFGPSNMAGISGDVDAGAGGGGGTEICTSCYYLNEFADRVKAANAPLDFIAASEYSKWDLNGFAPSAPMKDTIQILGKVAQRATGVTTTPVEVHEWGWAGWGKWNSDFGTTGNMDFGHGAFGGAWDLGSYLYQRAGGASRVFHWGGGLDNSLNRGVKGSGGNASGTCVPGTTYKKDCRQYGYPLITGHGWLLSALLQVQPQAVSTIQLSEYVTDIAVTTADREVQPYNHTVGAVRGLDTKQGHLTYVVLNYSPDFSEHVTRRFVLEIADDELRVLFQHPFRGEPLSPTERGCAALTVTQQVLNRSTSTHDAIEQELYNSGTKAAATKRAVDAVSTMATPEGLKHVVADAAHWMSHNRNSLRFSEFDGAIKGSASGGCALEFTLETPSMVLLRVVSGN